MVLYIATLNQIVIFLCKAPPSSHVLQLPDKYFSTFQI